VRPRTGGTAGARRILPGRSMTPELRGPVWALPRRTRVPTGGPIK
jgi:hypothetical protein